MVTPGHDDCGLRLLLYCSQRRKRDVISSCSVLQPANGEQQLHRHVGRVGTFIIS